MARSTLNTRCFTSNKIGELINTRYGELLERNKHNHYLSPKQIQRNDEYVKAIIDFIKKNFMSPFEEPVLMSLSNGVLLTEKIAEEKELAALNAFIENGLVKQTTAFYETIKKLKLSTFSTLNKSMKLKIQNKVVQLTAEKNIFRSITFMSQQRTLK